MISTCGIYAIRDKSNVFNAPFVALNNDQAIKIVNDAIGGEENEDIRSGISLYRIGTLHFTDGIIDTDIVSVLSFGVPVLSFEEDDGDKEVSSDGSDLS